ncbi:DUF4307 domain-containing protein [Cryobacterium melibiosiphilum]|uniref:DUF4307 domain-containing protein n=1 Tax=Cryobacterium melibiosiphilum TaxID=995039 RepID=A0A3A5MBH1_9MICO|nr:DUF4307 domain-containing protein [Cryobacterium melibiosiphilum]RJT86862.1 DUF4307 domain-containing protein [Cryobacterium melibiosiphilum]
MPPTPTADTPTAASTGRPSEGTTLESRYGRTPRARTRDKRALWALGGVFAVVLTAWIVWTGLDGASVVIEANDTHHSIIDDNSVSVTFEVSMPVNSASTCAVQALNESFTVIGWKIIELPPSPQYNRSFTEIVRTTELPNTGLIYECWLS